MPLYVLSAQGIPASTFTEAGQILVGTGNGTYEAVNPPPSAGELLGYSGSAPGIGYAIPSPRVVVITQSATPAIDSDNADIAVITGLAQNITSMTTNLTGTQQDGQFLEMRITDNGTARTITWGASFTSTTISLPTTTVASVTLRVQTQWNAATSTFDCVGVA